MLVDFGFETSPHRAVRMGIQVEPKNHLVEVLVGLRQLPRQRPVGCPPKPIVPDWFSGVRAHAASVDVEDKWLAFIHAVESELCLLSDIVEYDGSAKNSHRGRGRTLRTVQRLALPQRTFVALGKCVSRRMLLFGLPRS